MAEVDLSTLPTLSSLRAPDWVTKHAEEVGIRPFAIRQIIDPEAVTAELLDALRGDGNSRRANPNGEDRRNVALKLSVRRIDEMLADPTLPGHRRRPLEGARDSIANLAMKLNLGLARKSTSRFKDVGNTLNDEFDGESDAELAAAWKSWDPTRGALSTWAASALRGAAQKVLRDKQNLRSMSERAVARKQEIDAISERLRRDGVPVTVETVADASRPPIETVEKTLATLAELTEAGVAVDVATLESRLSVPGAQLRRIVAAVDAMADKDETITPDAVRDGAAISSYRIDQVLNAVNHVSMSTPLDSSEAGGTTLGDQIAEFEDGPSGLPPEALDRAYEIMASLPELLNEKEIWSAIARCELDVSAVRLPDLAAEMGMSRGRAQNMEKSAREVVNQLITRPDDFDDLDGDEFGLMAVLGEGSVLRGRKAEE